MEPDADGQRGIWLDDDVNILEHSDKRGSQSAPVDAVVHVLANRPDALPDGATRDGTAIRMANGTLAYPIGDGGVALDRREHDLIELTADELAPLMAARKGASP
jgi:hypothetical protein